MSETFFYIEDTKAKCALCDATKTLTKSKKGTYYWKYNILIIEQDHKHKWLKDDYGGNENGD